MGIDQYAEELFKGYTMRKDAYLDGYYHALGKAQKILKQMTKGRLGKAFLDKFGELMLEE